MGFAFEPIHVPLHARDAPCAVAMILRVVKGFVPDFEGSLRRLDRGAGLEADRVDCGVETHSPIRQLSQGFPLLPHRLVELPARFCKPCLGFAGGLPRPRDLFEAPLDPFGETRAIEAVDWREPTLLRKRAQDWLDAREFLLLHLEFPPGVPQACRAP